MDLLFKREQRIVPNGVNFKLWGKIELDDDEEAIVAKYQFDNAILVFVHQPGLGRTAFLIGALVGVVTLFVLYDLLDVVGIPLGLMLGMCAGYFWYHQHRETIYVKDLLHGRHFTCDSVIDLARKEAWLGTVVSFLRQVMESAKHWDGTERHAVDPLPPDEARQVIIQGL